MSESSIFPLIYLEKCQKKKKKVWSLHKQLGHLLHCSVAKLWLTLWDPLDWSAPGFPDLHYCLGRAQTHVHWVGDAILLSHYLSFPFSYLQSFQASGSFPMSQLFASGGHSIGASVSALVLPMNIQGWFPLGLTGLISLLSKELSRVFCTILWNHQFFSTQPS